MIALMKTNQNILNDISKLIFPNVNDHLWIRDDHKIYIETFIEDPTKHNAQELFKFLLEKKTKTKMNKFVSEMALCETALKNILPEQRDHYIHSVGVYLLGLAIYNSCNKIRDAVRLNKPYVDTESQKESFVLRWSIAACLHDIAYPLELSLKSFNKYSKNLNVEQQNLNVGQQDEKTNQDKKYDYSFTQIDRKIYDQYNILPVLNPDELSDISKKDTALAMISFRLSNFKSSSKNISFDTLQKYIENDLEQLLKKGHIDHGIFSALYILHYTHSIINDATEINSSSDTSPDYFYYEIVDSATAIFLHNYYKYSRLRFWFGNGKYLYDSPCPLGYLLFLCDTLAEWLRGENAGVDLFRLITDKQNYIFKAPEKVISDINKKNALFFDDRIKFSFVNI